MIMNISSSSVERSHFALLSPMSETIPFPSETSFPVFFPTVSRVPSASRMSSCTWKARPMSFPSSHIRCCTLLDPPQSIVAIVRHADIKIPVFSSCIRNSSSSESSSCLRKVSRTCPRATPRSPSARASTHTALVLPEFDKSSKLIV